MINKSLIIEKMKYFYKYRETNNLKIMAREIESIIIDEEHISEDLFEAFIFLIRQNKFYLDNESPEILMVIENQWGDFNEEQKQVILKIIENDYPKYKNWMSLFMLSEILGEYFNNETAFKILKKYKYIKDELHRSFIPHGFEHIAKNNSDKELSKAALNELLSMKNDKSSDVKKEVFEAMYNLGIKSDNIPS